MDEKSVMFVKEARGKTERLVREG